MKFDKENIDNLVREMRINRQLFYESTLTQVSSAQRRYHTGLKNISFGDEKNLRSIIEKTILNENNPIYSKAGLEYKVIGEIDASNEEAEDYEENVYAPFEREIEREYWTIAEKEARYKEISNFTAFLDVTVDVESATKYSTRGVLLLEVENWLEYYKNLISVFFSDFKFDIHRSSRVLRFTKSINDNVFLCLEYDQKLERQILNRGYFGLEKINIVVLNKDFDRRTKEIEYHLNTDPTIKFLCPAKHPIFRDPCISPGVFAARQISKNKTPGSFSTTKFEHLPDGKVRLYNSEEFGDLIKRHTFFYMDVYSFYLASYLKFLEECLQKTVAA